MQAIDIIIAAQVAAQRRYTLSRVHEIFSVHHTAEPLCAEETEVPEPRISLAAPCLPNEISPNPTSLIPRPASPNNPVLRSSFTVSVDRTIRLRNNDFVFGLPIHQVAIRDIIWTPLLDLPQSLNQNSNEGFFEPL